VNWIKWLNIGAALATVAGGAYAIYAWWQSQQPPAAALAAKQAQSSSTLETLKDPSLQSTATEGLSLTQATTSGLHLKLQSSTLPPEGPPSGNNDW
jgi:uncharacterized membrane protein YebE (DUF533 family)